MDDVPIQSKGLIDPRAWPGTVLLIVCGLIASFLFGVLWTAVIFGLLTLIHLAFFRDPQRKPQGEGLLAPADGKVVEVSVFDEPQFIKGRAVKIGIFLSIFDVHVNRAPWDGAVIWQKYVPGKFLNALDPESAVKNESNWIGFQDGTHRFVVRQISGLIARHIHSDLKEGQRLERGGKIGVICYGSRAEFYAPEAEFQALVKVGDVVKSSATVIGLWK